MAKNDWNKAHPEYFKKYREEHKEKAKEYYKQWRRTEKGQLSAKVNRARQRNYVQNNEWDKIEGYDMVLRSGHDYLNRGNWVVHHKLEREFSYQQLVAADMYYDRPPEELVWMTNSAHTMMHSAWRNKNKLG